MLTLPDVAVGAVVAAFIAALVSLIGLIISKEQKTSEFRQAWIDALRGEVAAVIAHANAIHGSAAANFDTSAKLWETARLDFVGINDATARIRLRLNPSEKDSQAVLGSISALESSINSMLMDSALLNETEKKLVEDAQILLKKEWRRVQRGEPFFVLAKAALAIFLFSAAVYLAVKAVQAN